MRNLKCIAFFWVGPDTTIPSLLVRSIRQAFGPDFHVAQLSDKETPRIEGVTTHKRLKLSPHIMVARLEAYAELGLSGPTLFVDADMLVLRAFDLPALGESEVGVTVRGPRDTMRFSPEECKEEPAFTGKNTLEVMPYLYSFVYAASPLLFVRQLNALRKMPRRYHRWYGDQMTLKSELDAPGRFTTRILDVDVYNRTVGSRMEFQEIQAGQQDVCLAHFKGRDSKAVMLEAMTMLESGAAAKPR